MKELLVDEIGIKVRLQNETTKLKLYLQDNQFEFDTLKVENEQLAEQLEAVLFDKNIIQKNLEKIQKQKSKLIDRLHLSETNETELKNYAEEIINQINTDEVTDPTTTLKLETIVNAK